MPSVSAAIMQKRLSSSMKSISCRASATSPASLAATALFPTSNCCFRLRPHPLWKPFWSPMNYAQANSSPELTTALTQSSATPQPRPKCWLIGSGAAHPRAVARIARLRALDVALCLADGGAIPPISASRNNLIAINFDLLARLGSEAKAALRKSVENGATVYVRGGLESERVYSLQ